MKLRLESTGRPIELDPERSLGAGGEARIYAVTGNDSLVAKIYHQSDSERKRKIRVMLADPPDDPLKGLGHHSISWPIDMLTGPAGDHAFAGYVMPRVSGGSPVFTVYNPSSRRQALPLFHYQYLNRTARNIAAAAQALHGRGYVIGDVNESNILVTETALISLVDTDSFQVRDPLTGELFRCPVGKPEFTPPELQNQTFATVDRQVAHDLFGIAVLFFQLLMEGTHPFAGVYQGGGDPPPYEARILAGHYPYGTRRTPYLPMPAAPPIEILHPTLRQLFVRCFEDGRSNPLVRPDAQTWMTVLTEAEQDLVGCSKNSQHRYGSHLMGCPWCRRANLLGGRDPFPLEAPLPEKRPRKTASRRTSPGTPTGYPATFSTNSGSPASWAASTAAYSGPSGSGWGAPAAPSLPNNGPAIGAVTAALAALFTPVFQIPELGVLLGLTAGGLGVLGWVAARRLQGSGRGLSVFSGVLGGITAFLLTILIAVHAVQARTLQNLSGNGGSIRSIAFSPDGNLLAAASSRVEADRAPGTVSIWDARGGRLRFNLQGFRGDVVASAFSPDSRLLATGSGGPMEYGELQLWDAEGGWLKQRLVRTRGYINAVAFSPDSQKIACGGSDGIIRVLDVRAGSVTQTLDVGEEVETLRFSPDGMLLAAGVGTTGKRLKPGKVMVWDEATGLLRWSHPAHSNSVMSIAFNGRGTTLVSGGQDNTVRLWDAANGRILRTLEGTGFWIAGVAFSPDGKLVASGGDEGKAILWDAGTGSVVHTYPALDPIATVAFDRSGQRLATGGAAGTVHLWRTSVSP